MPPGDGMQNIPAELEVLVLGGTSPAGFKCKDLVFEAELWESVWQQLKRKQTFVFTK